MLKGINVLSTRYLVENIFSEDVKLIYISTDAVYDGVKGDFSENDDINPQNYYGITKYKGELEVLKRKRSLVIRTNLFGWNIQDKKSLGEWILTELKENRQINCFQDTFFSSIYTFELARAIDIAIQNDLYGIYNCGSSNSCSKLGFAQKIADYFEFDKELVNPISIDNFPFKAKRGKMLTLNVNKLQKGLNYRLPTIDQSIEAFYKDYKCGLPGEIKNINISSQGSDIIPYGRQSISDNDVRSVVNVLRSERLTQGPIVEAFEQSLSEYCDARYGVTMNSATSALHAACLAANVGPGDEVITSPITFVASSNCVVFCNAKPVFADIDPKTYNIDPKEIEKR